MMSEERNKQQRLMMIAMDSLAPADHFLRKLDASVDMNFVYDVVRPMYSKYGRTSINSVVLVKMLLLDICTASILREA